MEPFCDRTGPVPEPEEEGVAQLASAPQALWREGGCYLPLTKLHLDTGGPAPHLGISPPEWWEMSFYF